MAAKVAALQVFQTKKQFIAIAKATASRFVANGELDTKKSAARASKVFTIADATIQLSIIDNGIPAAVVNEVNIPELITEQLLEHGYEVA